MDCPPVLVSNLQTLTAHLLTSVRLEFGGSRLHPSVRRCPVHGKDYIQYRIFGARFFLPPACRFAISPSVRPPSFRYPHRSLRRRIRRDRSRFELPCDSMHGCLNNQCFQASCISIGGFIIYRSQHGPYENDDLWFVVKFFLEVYSLYKLCEPRNDGGVRKSFGPGRVWFSTACGASGERGVQRRRCVCARVARTFQAEKCRKWLTRNTRLALRGPACHQHSFQQMRSAVFYSDSLREAILYSAQL